MDRERARQLQEIGHLHELAHHEAARALLEPEALVGTALALHVLEQVLGRVHHRPAPAEEGEPFLAESVHDVLAAAHAPEVVRRLVLEVGVVDPDLAAAGGDHREARGRVGAVGRERKLDLRPVVPARRGDGRLRVDDASVRAFEAHLQRAHHAAREEVADHLLPLAAGHAPAVEAAVGDARETRAGREQFARAAPVRDLRVAREEAVAARQALPLASADDAALALLRVGDHLGRQLLLEALVPQALRVESAVDLVVDVLHARAVDRARHLRLHLVEVHGHLRRPNRRECRACRGHESHQRHRRSFFRHCQLLLLAHGSSIAYSPKQGESPRNSPSSVISADGNTESTENSRRQGDCYGECASHKSTPTPLMISFATGRL